MFKWPKSVIFNSDNSPIEKNLSKKHLKIFKHFLLKLLALKRVADELQHYYLFMIKGPLFDVQYTIKLRFRFEHY